MKLPGDLEVQQSTVQTAVSDIASSLAQVGIPFDPKDAEQAKAFADFLRPDGDKSAGEGLEAVVERAPAVRVARAAVARALQQLAVARLRLSWTEIRSEVAGYVQDRQVHPGNRVQPGQTLLSIRRSYVWIDANYKETQLHYIRIGMPVDLYVDAYPGRVFKGRVAGFSPGTGLSESLLPPENATGNYVKVTQRLPVRIELAEPNPDDTPLFVGLSVVPHVRIMERPTGPGAGQRLHTFGRLRPPDKGAGPAGSQPNNRDRRGGREAMDATSGNGHGGGPRVQAPVNHWIVALTVTLATFMEVLDTSIANVALPYISGGLAVGRSQATWVLTSYLVANAIVLPLSGWLMGLFGRKRFYMTCVCPVHRQLGPLRRGAEYRALDLLPRAPGAWRRRAAAVRAGHPDRYVSAPPTGHGHGPLRRGDRRGTDPRAGARRLHQ